jgi:hypothetical protein
VAPGGGEGGYVHTPPPPCTSAMYAHAAAAPGAGGGEARESKRLLSRPLVVQTGDGDFVPSPAVLSQSANAIVKKLSLLMWPGQIRTRAVRNHLPRDDGSSPQDSCPSRAIDEGAEMSSAPLRVPGAGPGEGQKHVARRSRNKISHASSRSKHNHTPQPPLPACVTRNTLMRKDTFSTGRNMRCFGSPLRLPRHLQNHLARSAKNVGGVKVF